MGATRIHQFPAAARQYDLSATALRVLEELMLDPDTPPSVRLKAALAVLERSQPDDPHSPAARASTRPRESTVLRTPAATEIEAGEQQPTEPVPAIRPAPCPCGSGRKYKRCCGVKAPPVITSQSEAA